MASSPPSSDRYEAQFNLLANAIDNTATTQRLMHVWVPFKPPPPIDDNPIELIRHTNTQRRTLDYARAAQYITHTLTLHTTITVNGCSEQRNTACTVHAAVLNVCGLAKDRVFCHHSMCERHRDASHVYRVGQSRARVRLTEFEIYSTPTGVIGLVAAVQWSFVRRALCIAHRYTRSAQRCAL